MPELKVNRVWRRQKAQQSRALAVHHSDRPEHLQGSELDRLLAGLPNDKLAKEIARSAVPITKPTLATRSNAIPPLEMVTFLVTCSNCSSVSSEFGYLFRTYRQGDVTRRGIELKGLPGEFPTATHSEPKRIPFCPLCPNMPLPESYK